MLFMTRFQSKVKNSSIAKIPGVKSTETVNAVQPVLYCVLVKKKGLASIRE